MAATLYEMDMVVVERMLRDRGLSEYRLFPDPRTTPPLLQHLQADFHLLGVAMIPPTATCYQFPAEEGASVFDGFGFEQAKAHERLCIVHSLQVGKPTKPKLLKAFVEHMKSLAIQHVILFSDKKICNGGLISTCTDLVLESLSTAQKTVVDYVLVDPHRRLTEEEAAVVKATYGELRLKLLTSDAVSSYYGFPPGCVVEILMDNDSCGQLPEYRVVTAC